jgi:hypothetical protein
MTTTQVMNYVGLHNRRGVSVWCARRGISAVDRGPGNKGENRYLRSDIERGRQKQLERAR